MTSENSAFQHLKPVFREVTYKTTNAPKSVKKNIITIPALSAAERGRTCLSGRGSWEPPLKRLYPGAVDGGSSLQKTGAAHTKSR